MAIALGKNPPIQSNLLKGIDNYLGVAQSVVQVC